MSPLPLLLRVSIPTAFAGIVLSILFVPALRADGPTDNLPDKVRPIPPPGVAVPAEKAAALRKELETLGARIEALRQSKAHQEVIAAYLADVEICHRAVRDALDYNEFFKENEIEFASTLLATGLERADALAKGETPWTRQTGFVIRAYRSRIDGSAQPYGLEIPAHYRFDDVRPWRLDCWFHGRGETLGEVAFLMQRTKGQGGKINAPDAIILHPYGRYSNANKFAGEVDLFEALEHAGRDYRIDPDRTLVRGFSMGGAACWQFAVHYPGKWAAAQPGAGFSETPEFLRTFQEETLHPSWWEEKLWRCYDATHWALNLSNYPVIVYSGEIDRQKQAGDMMVAAAEREGLRLTHLIGPQTAHAIHPGSLKDIESRLAVIAEKGRERIPETVRFVTHTLRYDSAYWIRVDHLARHWEPGRIEASWKRPNRLTVSVSGIDGFSVRFAAGECPLDPLADPVAEIEGRELKLPRVWSDRSWEVSFHRDGSGNWTASEKPPVSKDLRKRHGLQGPIDDAFMDAFVHVTPSGEAFHEATAAWVRAEQPRAVREWRRQFRGDAPVMADKAEASATDRNLILWGDPSSNAVLARILAHLPVTWTRESLVVNGKSYDASHHVLAMVYPNPENPDRYVVLNSGFTYREYDYLNNARQTPKLPDWAVIDLRTPPGSQKPGAIVDAGFFDEDWKFQPGPTIP